MRITLAIIFLFFFMVSCSKNDIHSIKETITEHKVFDQAGISDMSFVNKNTGFISGTYDMDAGAALIAKTSDGGITWQQIPVYINSPTSIIRSIYAKNKDTIYATYNAINNTYGVCFSKDVGMAWSALGSPKPFVAYTGLFFKNAQTGFVCGGGSVWKTNDGGHTWQQKYYTNNFLGIGKLFFTSKLIGYAYGGFCDDGGCLGIIVKTTDGGDTWKHLPLKELATSLNFISDNVGYAFTFDNNIYKTIDGGMSWQLLNNTDGGAYFSSVVDGTPKYFATNEWIYRSDNDFSTFRKIYTTSKPGALSVKAVHPAPNVVYFAAAGRSIIKLIIHR